MTAANVNDCQMVEQLLDAVPPVHGPRGAPRRRPAKLHGDKGYDYEKCRAACWRRRIAPRIARKGTDPKDRLGRHRWKVERTLAWIKQFAKLRIRTSRCARAHHGLLQLACALIAWRRIRRYVLGSGS
jgi:IS5 family transposase